jgi:hypothetical protein
MADITEKVFRQGDEEKTPVVRATSHPEVMRELRPIHPNRESLNNSQLEAATKELYHKDYTKLDFPRNMKFAVDPKVSGQTYGLISFLPSKNAVPDKDGCFGILKLRGNFSSEVEADKWAEKIIKDHDTYADIDTVFVGRPFPLFVDNEKYASKTREIDIRKVVTDIQKSSQIEKQQKEQKEIQEIQERQRKLLNKETEEEKDKSVCDLDYYVTLRVKKANAMAAIDDAEKRIKEAQEVIDNVSKEIEEFDEKEPTYKEEYVEKYKNALGVIGANPEENPLIKYMNR